MLEKQTYRVRLTREVRDRETGETRKEEKFVTVEAEGGSLAFMQARDVAGRSECWSPMSFEILKPDAGEKQDKPAV